MTDWQTIIDHDFAIPAGRPPAELLAELLEALRSPDPDLRDEQALPVLAAWIPGLDAALRDQLGDRLAAMFGDPEIQARTFAPLALAVVVRSGGYRAEWVAAFADWYVAETDLRGHDASMGWLHAVAHGSDLLRVLSQEPQVRTTDMLDLAVARMLAPTEFVWRDQEDDRLAHALAVALTRPELSEAESVGWLDAIQEAFEIGEPGPVPPFASNTIRTLRALYLLADHGTRKRWDQDAVALTHGDAVKRRLTEVLAVVTPMLG